MYLKLYIVGCEYKLYHHHSRNKMDNVQARQGTSVPPSPSASPAVRNTLVTVDIVVLVVYFLTILAVGFWVSTGASPSIRHWSKVTVIRD